MSRISIRAGEFERSEEARSDRYNNTIAGMEKLVDDLKADVRSLETIRDHLDRYCGRRSTPSQSPCSSTYAAPTVQLSREAQLNISIGSMRYFEGQRKGKIASGEIALVNGLDAYDPNAMSALVHVRTPEHKLKIYNGTGAEIRVERVDHTGRVDGRWRVNKGEGYDSAFSQTSDTRVGVVLRFLDARGAPLGQFTMPNEETELTIGVSAAEREAMIDAWFKKRTGR